MTIKWISLLLCSALVKGQYPSDVPFLGLNPFGQPLVDGDYVVGDEIPGVAGVDYPVYGEVPRTGFTCDAHPVPGYYADPLSGCQAFYICGESGRGASFLCPNGTVFNQKELVCDWWYDFDCGLAEQYYSVNDAVVAAMAAVDAANGVVNPASPSPLIAAGLLAGSPAAASLARRLPAAALATRFSPLASATSAIPGVSPLAYNPATAGRLGALASPLGRYAAPTAAYAARYGLPGAAYTGRYGLPGATYAAAGSAYTGPGSAYTARYSLPGGARYGLPGAAYAAPGSAYTGSGGTYAGRYGLPGAAYTAPGSAYTGPGAAYAARYGLPGAAYAGRYGLPGAAYAAPGSAYTVPGAAYAARYGLPGTAYAGRYTTPGAAYTTPGAAYTAPGYTTPGAAYTAPGAAYTTSGAPYNLPFRAPGQSSYALTPTGAAAILRPRPVYGAPFATGTGGGYGATFAGNGFGSPSAGSGGGVPTTPRYDDAGSVDRTYLPPSKK